MFLCQICFLNFAFHVFNSTLISVYHTSMNGRLACWFVVVICDRYAARLIEAKLRFGIQMLISEHSEIFFKVLFSALGFLDWMRDRMRLRMPIITPIPCHAGWLRM